MRRSALPALLLAGSVASSLGACTTAGPEPSTATDGPAAAPAPMPSLDPPQRAEGPRPPEGPARAVRRSPVDVDTAWVASLATVLSRAARPRGDERNERRFPLAALPGSMGLEHVSFLSSLRDQARAEHDEVWLLLTGEGDLGMATTGHHLISGSIVFVPAGTVHYFTTSPRVESTFLQLAGPDLVRDDLFLPSGERAKPVIPLNDQGQPDPSLAAPHIVPARTQGGDFAAPGRVVLWQLEANKLEGQVRAAKATCQDMVYSSRHLTLTALGVADGEPLTRPYDQAIIVIQVTGSSRKRLVVGGAGRRLRDGDMALLPANTPLRIEGASVAEPVYLLSVVKTDPTTPTPPPAR